MKAFRRYIYFTCPDTKHHRQDALADVQSHHVIGFASSEVKD